jgi:REP element-mobilizing transposase RayT
MARKLRLAYPRAIYHLMNRGDRREAVFTDDADRRRFLDCLGEACAKTQWPVHAFCLMPNHFHRVLATTRANLFAGMKWVLGTWANAARRLYEAIS